VRKNYFAKQMTDKTDSELIWIISNDSLVEEVKQAAAWELDERNIENDYKSQKQIINDFSEEINHNDRESLGRKKYYENRLFLFGLTCIACAMYLFVPTIFTFKKSLISIDGKLNKVDIVIQDVSSSKGLGYQVKSRRAILFFSLDGVNKRFEVIKNIDRDHEHENISLIKTRLKNSEKVTVWIKESEIDSMNPKIFQIDIDNKTLLSLNDVKTEKLLAFIFLLLIGFGSSGFVLRKRYHDKFKAIIK
jgi:hypothetical protein